jgi:hypothetical protein
MSNVINLMPTQATADEVLEDCYRVYGLEGDHLLGGSIQASSNYGRT